MTTQLSTLGATIKTAYEGQPDTNAFTDALKTKLQGAAYLAGIGNKVPCRVATAVNITLSGTQTIDGVALSVGDRVCVRAQTSSVNNGIYIVQFGAWTRATDCAAGDSIVLGAIVRINEGNVYGGVYFAMTNATAVIGTDPIVFTPEEFSQAQTTQSGFFEVESFRTGGMTDLDVLNAAILASFTMTGKVIIRMEAGRDYNLTSVPDLETSYKNCDVIIDWNFGRWVITGDVGPLRIVHDYYASSNVSSINNTATRDLAFVDSHWLSFDNQTANFTTGQVVTGATSGAHGVIDFIEDAGSLGTLALSSVSGTFPDNEVITDPLGGSALVAADMTQVSSFTVSSASNITTGTIGKLFSDDLGTWPVPSLLERKGEFLRVGEIVGTTVYTTTRLRDTYTTGIKFAPMRTDKQICLLNPAILYVDGGAYNWNKNAIEIQGAYMPEVRNTNIGRRYRQAVTFLGCYGARTYDSFAKNLKTHSPVNSTLNGRVGYQVSEYSCEAGRHQFLYMENGRHGYTTGVAETTVGSDTPYEHGPTRDAIIENIYGRWNQTALTDCHADGENITFVNVVAIDPYAGTNGTQAFAHFRGRNNRIVNLFTRGHGRVIAENEWASPDNCRGHTIDNWTHIWPENCDVLYSPIEVIGFQLVTGTATAGTSTTLTDGAASFPTSGTGLTNFYVGITAGTGLGQKRKIISNTATVLTVGSSFDVTPDATSVYEVYACPDLTVRNFTSIRETSISNNPETNVTRGIINLHNLTARAKIAGTSTGILIEADELGIVNLYGGSADLTGSTGTGIRLFKPSFSTAEINQIGKFSITKGGAAVSFLVDFNSANGSLICENVHFTDDPIVSPFTANEGASVTFAARLTVGKFNAEYKRKIAYLPVTQLWSLGDAIDVVENRFRGTALNTNTMLASLGSDATGTVPAVIVNKGVTVRTGDGPTYTMASVGSQITSATLAWKPSFGPLIFETEISVSAIANVCYNIGLTDNTALEIPFEIGASDVVTSNATDAVALGFDSNSTSDKVFLMGVAADVDKTAVNLNVNFPTVAKSVYRIQINELGDAAAFINGVYVGKVDLAVTPSAALCAYIGGMPRSGGSKSISCDLLRVAQF